jgi:hypothetical protein
MPDPQRELDLLRRRALGWGPACELIDPGDLGRDVRLADGPGGLDLARVEALDNLGQALAVALTTLRGSDVFNVAFGFDGLNALAEETDPVMVRERVRVSVIQVLRKDARVRRILDVQLADGRLETPSRGPAGQLDVRVVFETISGDQATVDLGRLLSDA